MDGLNEVKEPLTDATAVDVTHHPVPPAPCELQELLRSYGEVLRRADALPPVLWLRTRPAGASALSRWWRHPHPTWGTSYFVLYHIHRSVNLLCRVYAMREALGDLDEHGRAERNMVATFRDSLRPVRWRWFALAASLLTLLLGRAVVKVLLEIVDLLSFGLTPPFAKERMEAVSSLMDGLTTASATWSALSLAEVSTQLDAAGISGVLLLLASLVIAGYAVLRLTVPAFRLKRVLFNLADHPASAVTGTTSTWHTSRSVGLYERERCTFAAVGIDRVPREKPLDLLLSVLITTAILWVLLGLIVSDAPSSLRQQIENVLFLLPLFIYRFAWLTKRYRARQDASPQWASPTGALLPATARVVDVRPVTEAAALATTFWLLPSPIHRLLGQGAALRREHREQALEITRRPNRVGILVLTGMCFMFWPLLILAWGRTTRGVPGSRLNLPYLLACGLSLAWPYAVVVFFTSEYGSYHESAAFLTCVHAPGLAFLSLQASHNRLVRRWATPLPVDVVPRPLPARQFLPPLGWPTPPPGWQPQQGWRPPPEWPPVPAGARAWVRPLAGSN